MLLIIDTETTNLPKGSDFTNVRMVQLTMLLCDPTYTPIQLKDFIVKRDRYSIDNYKFHGITNEISDKEGIDIREVFQELSILLQDTTHILAHNAEFDTNVIQTELKRYNLIDVLEQFNKKKVVCTMKLTKNIVMAKNKNNMTKNPKLSELYKFATERDIANAHNAKYDVLNLHQAMKCLYTKGLLNI